MPSRTLTHDAIASHDSKWRSLAVHPSELCLATTLKCGQSFRWKYNEITNTYSCTLRGRIVQLKQEHDLLLYRAMWPSSSQTYKSTTTTTRRKQKRTIQEPPTPPASMDASASSSPSPGLTSIPDGDDTLDLVRHYLNLGPNLSGLYTQWSDSDKNFAKKAPRFTGIRILRQDAWEALICFICSSNNNIARIGQMVDKLCAEYGQPAGEIEWPVLNIEEEKEDHQNHMKFFDFPKPGDLLGSDVEGRLRELGFGYRARYIAVTARIVCERGGIAWVDSLRNPECPSFASGLAQSREAGEMKDEGRDGFRAAHEALLELQGVGPKVADCVCLMGLAWGEAVPVDTHVWQIAQRDYKFGKGKHSSLTKATYDAVGNHFRRLWGKEAGWAHSVLFTADLRAFSDRLVAKIEVKKEEKDSLLDDNNGDAYATEIASTGTVKRISIKREVVEEDDEDDGLKLKIEVNETVMAISTTNGSNERLKRRRKR